jgi:nitrogen regulatory protein PII
LSSSGRCVDALHRKTFNAAAWLAGAGLTPRAPSAPDPIDSNAGAIMEFKRVIAIIPSTALGPLEARLRTLQVSEMTVSRVKGYGQYKNLFKDDWMSELTKLEIFTEASKVDSVVDAMLEVERGDSPSAGVVAVIPVERLLYLGTGAETVSESKPG